MLSWPYFEEEIFEPEEPETLEEPDAEEVPAEEPQKKEAVSRPERAAVEVQEPEPEQPVEDTVSERELTAEEKELFGEFIHHRKTERQLVRTLDNMSLSPYTGNVLITGEEDEFRIEGFFPDSFMIAATNALSSSSSRPFFVASSRSCMRTRHRLMRVRFWSK